MEKENKNYLPPEACVVQMCSENMVCVSNLGAIIIATEEEGDSGDWSNIY